MKKETIELKVSDIVCYTHKATISRFCPECRSDLKGPGALLHTEYTTVTWRTEYLTNKWEDRTVVGEDCFPKEWHCAYCGRELLASEEKDLGEISFDEDVLKL